MKLLFRLLILWLMLFEVERSGPFAQTVMDSASEGSSQTPSTDAPAPPPDAQGAAPEGSHSSGSEPNQTPDTNSSGPQELASPGSRAAGEPQPRPDLPSELTLPTPQVEESPLPSLHTPAPSPIVPHPEAPPVPLEAEPMNEKPPAQSSATPSQAEEEAAPPESMQPSPLVTTTEANPLDEARVLLLKGEYLDAATRFRQTVRDYPDLIEARLALGEALAALGDMDGALEEYRRVIQRDPQATAGHLKVAGLLMAKRHWKEAQAALNIAVAQQPTHPQAHYAMGVIRYSVGDTGGAIEAFRRVIELKPDSADAHYQLGLLLKLTKQKREAAVEFATAAAAGHPRAQYFIGAAYASGSGIDKQMATAVQWWMAAEDHGVQEAHDALARLRRAVYKWPDTPEGIKAAQAFAAYRDALWKEFPSITRSDREDSLGGHLLALNHIGEAIPVLIREASAMDTLAGSQLALIYERGADPIVAPFDTRILRYFQSAASEGVPQAKLTLARIRALGLGVPADKQSALNLLKGLHGIKAEQLLADWAAAANGAIPPPTGQAQQSGTAPGSNNNTN